VSAARGPVTQNNSSPSASLRVSPRRASVLAYITNQLLHSHRAIDYDDDRHSDEPVTIIMDVPRPDRSQDEDFSPAIQRT
jgi:hypothetical protein